MSRGYFGVAVYHPKHTANIGSLWRTAHIMGAAFFATIGKRYRHQPTDTYKSIRHTPLFEYESWDLFKTGSPRDCQIIGVELAPQAMDLASFTHPHRAVYVLGAEDYGLPPAVLSDCNHVVRMRGEASLNVAVAGSIVLYHREGLRGL